jgi:hypothetical protein
MRVIFVLLDCCYNENNILLSSPSLPPFNIQEEEKYEYMNNVKYNGAKNTITSLHGKANNCWYVS